LSTKETTKTHHNTLKNLLTGYFKARKYLSQHPQDAARLMAHDNTSVQATFWHEVLKLPDLEENRALLNDSLQDTIIELLITLKWIRFQTQFKKY